MKRSFLIAAIMLGIAGSLQSHQSHRTDQCATIVTDSLSAYTGKYKMKREDNMEFYLTLSIENGQLVALELWDNAKKHLNHISGDDFIVDGFGWAVRFERDEHKKVKALVVRGTDTWMKVTE